MRSKRCAQTNDGVRDGVRAGVQKTMRRQGLAKLNLVQVIELVAVIEGGLCFGLLISVFVRMPSV